MDALKGGGLMVYKLLICLTLLNMIFLAIHYSYVKKNKKTGYFSDLKFQYFPIPLYRPLYLKEINRVE